MKNGLVFSAISSILRKPFISMNGLVSMVGALYYYEELYEYTVSVLNHQRFDITVYRASASLIVRSCMLSH